MAVLQGVTTLASFVYDGKGRRTQKAAGGVTHTYLYDQRNLIEERISSGQTLDYVQGPGIDRPLAQRDQTAAVSYYLADHLGSIAQMTNNSGVVALTREYDPWGNLLQGSSSAGYAFTGREWDAELGLSYHRARYYSPGLGRWLSEDPIGVAGGMNFYAYAKGRAVSFNDPLGLRIHMNLSDGPPVYNLSKTCSGDAGGTCYYRLPFTLGACHKKGSCYAFDATVTVKLWEEFTVSQAVANTPGLSAQSPGLSLQQHEDLHMQDFHIGLSDSAVNKAIPTDGFKTPSACTAARQGFLGELDAFIAGIANTSNVWRDYM